VRLASSNTSFVESGFVSHRKSICNQIEVSYVISCFAVTTLGVVECFLVVLKPWRSFKPFRPYFFPWP